MRRLYPLLRRSFFEDSTALGGGVLSTLLALLILFLGISPLWYQLAVGLLVIPVVCVAIRHLYFKPRPHIEPYTSWAEKMYASSFPSIHAARIWFVCAMLFLSFRNLPIFVLLFVVACIVSYSRISLDKHDWLDVLSGSVLGLAVAAIMLMI